jgi:glucokinase
MTEIVAADIGGTHARFALARIEGPDVTGLTEAVVLKTGEFADLPAAWRAFAERIGRPLPRAAGIAVAGPVAGPELRLTNSFWTLRPAGLSEMLGLDHHILVNDFGAVGHAVARLDGSNFRHLIGPDRRPPDSGVISVLGPGTGLGVALVTRSAAGSRVIETEAAHAGFSPLDALDDQILARLRRIHGRVSIERVVSGPGLAHIHAALAEREGRAPVAFEDEAGLWARALDGADLLAAAALERFCLNLGVAAGDIALTQGATAVVIAGGLGLRIAGHLAGGAFERGFLAKGRFESRMADMPVNLLTHPQPGLFGAAVAFAQQLL